MLFVCDILEHLKEMIGQSAINRRGQSSIPNSLRGYRGKTARPQVTGRRGGGGELGGLFSVKVLTERRAFTIIIVSAKSWHFGCVIIQLIACGS